MARTLPESCLRELGGCMPLHAIESDCKMSYICCGLVDENERTTSTDCFRLCCATESTDMMYDHDELDLLDFVEVIMRSMSTKRRLEDANGQDT